MAVDPNPPVTTTGLTLETVGNLGIAGPAPTGTANVVSNRSTEGVSTDATLMGTYPHGVVASQLRVSPPATSVSTSYTDGTDAVHVVPDVSLTGTLDTTVGGGWAQAPLNGTVPNPVYRAPSLPPPVVTPPSGAIATASGGSPTALRDLGGISGELDTSGTQYPVTSGSGLPDTPGVANTAVQTDTSTLGGGVGAGIGAGSTAVPAAPTGISVARRLYGARVGWTAPAAISGAPTTGFVIEAYQNTTGSVDSFQSGQTTLATANANNALVTWLDPDVPINFKVYATNHNGNGAKSALSAAVTPYGPASGGANAPVVPGAPTIGAATAIANRSASVAFSAPADDGGNAINYYTAVSTPGSITATSSSSPIVLHGLTAGTSYTFKVKATNSSGDSVLSAASNAVTALAAVPGAPTIGVATKTGATTATVAFTAPVDNGGAAITAYVVTSTPAGGSTISTTSPLAVTGLTTATAYTFKVKATNSAGTGVDSASSNSITTD